MTTKLRFGCTCFLALLCLLRAAPASAAATFTPLGDLPLGDFASEHPAVSANGLVAVAKGWSEFGYEAFRWTSGGVAGLGDLAGGDFFSQPSRVNADGSVIVGESHSSLSTGPDSREAFRWTSGGGMVGLGDLAGGEFHSSAHGVSGNGSVVVGVGSSAPSRLEAFRWTSGGGMVGLGFLPTGGDSSAAWDVSGDGSIVVGENLTGADSQAFRWTSGGGMVGIGDLPEGETGSSANSISSDGSTIVGWSFSASGREAFRWTSAGGMVGLGDIPLGGFESIAHGVSADGSVIVGAGFGESGLEAFIWDASSGIRNLRTVLMNDYGIPMFGWTLTNARGVSADGLTIVGDGENPEGNLEAWMVTLPAQNDIVVPPNFTRVFANIRATSLTLVGERSVAIVDNDGTDVGTSAIGTLSIGPLSKLDLTDNDLVIRSTAAEKNAEHAAIQATIVSAQNGLDPDFVTKWDGPGITSSAARSLNTAFGFDLVGLGVIRNSDIDVITGLPGASYTTFSGQLVTPDDILVKYTYIGDGNLDGVVSFDDYVGMDNAFFGLIPNLGWATGDINFDGVINFDDYTVVDQAFFFQGAPLSRGDVWAVPEPAGWLTAVLVLFAAHWFIRRLTTSESTKSKKCT